MLERFVRVLRNLSLRTMIAGLMVAAVIGAVGALAAGEFEPGTAGSADAPLNDVTSFAYAST